MPRLVDYAERQEKGSPDNIGDIVDREVKIVSVVFQDGEYGEYAVFDIVDADGELRSIQTTGMLVIDALKHADAENAFPLDVTFRRPKRTYKME